MARLGAGDVAPHFQTLDFRGCPVDLRAMRGSFVFLSFFRNAACAICNLRVHQLIARHDELAQAGIAVIAIFESPPNALRRYVGRQDAPFPIVGDAGGTLYDLFGLENDEAKVAATSEMPGTAQVVADAAAAGFPLMAEAGANFLRLPADFVIDPGGAIVRAHYAEHVGDHTPIEDVVRCASLTTRTA